MFRPVLETKGLLGLAAQSREAAGMSRYFLTSLSPSPVPVGAAPAGLLGLRSACSPQVEQRLARSRCPVSIYRMQ